MSFGEKLAKYFNEHNMDQKELAKMLGVREQTISTYITKKNNPTYDRFMEICSKLGVDANYFMDDELKNKLSKEVTSKELAPKDKHILDQYRNLTPNNKSIVDYIFGMEEEEVKPTKIYYFPVFFQSAAAGIGQLSETNDYQMEELKLKTIPKEAKFGMYIVGNSMETDIYENDIVLIDPSQTTPDELDGAIVVARFGEELVCKTLSVNIDTQTYDFTSNNSGASDKSRLNQKQGSFRLVGKVVRIIHANIIGEGIVTYHDD